MSASSASRTSTTAMRDPLQARAKMARRRCGSAPKRKPAPGQRIDAVAEYRGLGFRGRAVVGHVEPLGGELAAVEQRALGELAPARARAVDRAAVELAAGEGEAAPGEHHAVLEGGDGRQPFQPGAAGGAQLAARAAQRVLVALAAVVEAEPAEGDQVAGPGDRSAAARA